MHPSVLTAIIVVLSTCLLCTPFTSASTTTSVGDATIASDEHTGTWTLSVAGTSLALGLAPSRDAEILTLSTSSGKAWTRAVGPDTVVQVAGQTFPFGRRSSGFVYSDVRASRHDQTFQLNATFDLPAQRLRVTRHYAITAGSPTFELWTTFVSLSREAVPVSDLNGLTVPEGVVRWLTGLRGDNAGAAIGRVTDTAERTGILPTSVLCTTCSPRFGRGIRIS